MMLEAVGLTKRYVKQGPVALRELNLQIAPGEVFCLLGANGAGKTTTINLFLGFLRPTSGEARVDGVVVGRDPLAARGRLAYLPEQVALYPQLTGLENLRYFTALGGLTLSRDELGRHLIDAGLAADAAGARVATYSKGMRQKVGLAYALAKRAGALLLDEPTSGLDPRASHEFGAALRKLAATGTAVLMATHDLFRAREVGGRAAIMRGGVLCEVLALADVSAAELERRYLAHMMADGPKTEAC